MQWFFQIHEEVRVSYWSWAEIAGGALVGGLGGYLIYRLLKWQDSRKD